MSGMLINVGSSSLVNSDVAFPTVSKVDKRINPGTLVLVDPMHSSNPWPAGVPANGASIPNLAWESAKAILSAGTESSLACSFVDNHLTADALFERTSKGALHAIYSQSAQTGSSSRGAAIVLPTSIQNYLLANPTRKYRVSLRGRVTRVGITGSAVEAPFSFQFKNGSAGTYQWLMLISGNFPSVDAPAGASLGRYVNPGPNSLGRFFRSQGWSGWTGSSPPTDIANLVHAAVAFGNYGPFATLAQNKAPSWAFESFALEDLDIAGLTYAQSDAVDREFWSQDSRYLGDTNTDPATKP